MTAVPLGDTKPSLFLECESKRKKEPPFLITPMLYAVNAPPTLRIAYLSILANASWKSLLPISPLFDSRGVTLTG